MVKATKTSRPFQMTLNSSQLAAGAHTIAAKAYDDTGNVGTWTTKVTR